MSIESTPEDLSSLVSEQNEATTYNQGKMLTPLRNFIDTETGGHELSPAQISASEAILKTLSFVMSNPALSSDKADLIINGTEVMNYIATGATDEKKEPEVFSKNEKDVFDKTRGVKPTLTSQNIGFFARYMVYLSQNASNSAK